VAEAGLSAVEQINTAMFPNALIASTPKAAAADKEEQLLLVANAGNSTVAAMHISKAEEHTVLGDIPKGASDQRRPQSGGPFGGPRSCQRQALGHGQT
jgi:hypothetical protein